MEKHCRSETQEQDFLRIYIFGPLKRTLINSINLQQLVHVDLFCWACTAYVLKDQELKSLCNVTEEWLFWRVTCRSVFLFGSPRYSQSCMRPALQKHKTHVGYEMRFASSFCVLDLALDVQMA